VLDEAARKRGLRLRLRYEYLSADVLDDSRLVGTGSDDMLAVEEEMRSVVERMRTNDEMAGRRRRALCSHCAYRSILPRQRGAGRARRGPCSRRMHRTPPIASQRDRSSLACRRRRRQVSQRVEAGPSARSPIDLLTDAAGLADADTGSRRIVARPRRRRRDLLRSARGVRRPGALSRRHLGIVPKRPRFQPSRQQPATLANEMAERIQRNELDVAFDRGCGVDAHAVAGGGSRASSHVGDRCDRRAIG